MDVAISALRQADLVSPKLAWTLNNQIKTFIEVNGLPTGFNILDDYGYYCSVLQSKKIEQWHFGYKTNCPWLLIEVAKTLISGDTDVAINILRHVFTIWQNYEAGIILVSLSTGEAKNIYLHQLSIWGYEIATCELLEIDNSVITASRALDQGCYQAVAGWFLRLYQCDKNNLSIILTWIDYYKKPQLLHDFLALKPTLTSGCGAKILNYIMAQYEKELKELKI